MSPLTPHQNRRQGVKPPKSTLMPPNTKLMTGHNAMSESTAVAMKPL